VTNALLRAAPKELHIGMHLCRGNRGGHWHAEGSYEEVADRLFNALDIPFYFLEYDTPRAGSFTPLRFVPSHKSVVLGLVSTKSAELESKAALLARVEDAAKFVSLDRLAVSPQCGFASVETGNPVTPAVQEAKLALVGELAREVWRDG
jgi:5-methyltetrahydropteroyltriglutamate--homocysteine methyltransferase